VNSVDGKEEMSLMSEEVIEQFTS